MNPFQVLLIKEFRQNSFIYVIPFIFMLIALFYQFINPHWLSANWAQIIALVVPLALACSYGLQAFDLEENAQTRDFLTTKPVSIETILWAKFYSGLLILLPLTLLWSLTFFPQQVRVPFPLTYFRNIWFTAFLMLVFIIYLASLAAGVWVKGPKKLLAGTVLSFFFSLIFFYGWFEFMTFIYLNFKLNSIIAQLEAGFAMVVVTAGLLYLLIFLFHKTVAASLRNEFQPSVKKSLIIASSVLLMLPIALGMINWFDRPAIRPFNSLYSTLFSRENWFVGSQANRQPNGDLYVFANQNYLGVGRINQKPNMIYKASSISKIFSPVWSPDGTRIAMVIDEEAVIINTAKGNSLQNLGFSANQVAWSNDGRKLLLSKNTGSREITSGTQKITIYSYLISQVDLQTNSIEFKRTISFPGTSFAWNSIENQIIALRAYAWTIGIITLDSAKIELLNVPGHSYEQVVFSHIIPSSTDSHLFRIFFLTFDSQKKPKIYIYKFESTSGKLILESILKNPPLYRDFTLGDRPERILVSTVDGVYRLQSLPKGVARDGSNQ